MDIYVGRITRRGAVLHYVAEAGDHVMPSYGIDALADDICRTMDKAHCGEELHLVTGKDALSGFDKAYDRLEDNERLDTLSTREYERLNKAFQDQIDAV